MDKELNIIAGMIITDSKLNKLAKLQLLNWLQKEATESQVKVLLMDGKIVKLDDQAEMVVNDRFKVHKLNEALFKTILGNILLSPPGWVMYRTIRGLVSKKSRQCGVFGIGKKRDVCMLKVKADSATRMANLFSSQAPNCNKSKNPEKCKAKSMEQIKKYKAHANKLNSRISMYQTKTPKKAMKGIEKAGQSKAKIF